MKSADEVARKIMGELGLIGSSTISWEDAAEKHLAGLIEDTLDEARRKGAEEFRERAAQCGDKCSGAFMGHAIRALPLDKGEEDD